MSVPHLFARRLKAGETRTRVLGLLIVGAGMIALGVVLRGPTAGYAGPLDQGAFNAYIYQFPGSYSDITSLYFRDQLWVDRVPYFDYRLEYPVGIGALIGLATSLTGGVMSYFLLHAAVLSVAAVLMLWLTPRFEDANPWLLALWPTLPLYVVLNWDFLALLPMVAALLLFRRDRDRLGALALVGAVWTKFFPIVLLPLVVLDRLCRRRWRDALDITAVVTLMSVVINAPFALESSPEGLRLRDAWLYFFRFNQERSVERWSANLWNRPERFQLSWTTEQVNAYSAVLLILGFGLVALLMYTTHVRGGGVARDLILPASLAMIGWWLFINKVYSVQYTLWIAVPLALLAARSSLATSLAAGLAGADFLYYAAVFIEFYFGWSLKNSAASEWLYMQAIWPATALREVMILAVVLWAAWQVLQPAFVVSKDVRTLERTYAEVPVASD